MKQAVMVVPGKIEFHHVKKPKPGLGEILINVKRIGVCGSDIHVWHGKHPFTSYPIVQGHEFCGIVEEVGSDVENVRPGMLATARPQLVCGKCKPCARGDYNICEELKVQGFQSPGCAQGYFVTAKERVLSLPGNLTLEQGALIEPVAVGVHATAVAGKLTGKNVVVFGAGTIGNIVAQSCLARGVKKVLIVDVEWYRLNIAKECSIQNISNASEETFKDAQKRVFGDEGFQVVFEAAGAQQALTVAVDNIEKGGVIVILGVFSSLAQVNMAKVGEHQLCILGSLMYKHEDYQEAAKMISSGKIITEPIVTKHFPFEQYAEAYKFIDEQGSKTMKVMIDL